MKGRVLIVILVAFAITGCGGKQAVQRPSNQSGHSASTETQGAGPLDLTSTEGGASSTPSSAPTTTEAPGASSSLGNMAVQVNQTQVPAACQSPPIALSRPGPVHAPLDIDKAYAVGASGQNTNIRLTASDLRISTAVGGTQARPGQQYVVVSTEWKNLVPPKTVRRPKSGGQTGIVGGEMETVVLETPYEVPTLSENLYLVVDGRYVAEVSAATEQLPSPLPMTGLLIEHYNDEVKGAAAFEVPAGTFQNLTLQFYDFTQGHITLPVYGTAPSSQEKPMAGPVCNQLVKVALYRMEFSRKIGQTEAPAGSRYVIVDLGASSIASGAATQLDVDQYATLFEDGVYQVQPVKEVLGMPYQFRGLVRFIPGFVRHGTLVFLVPEQAGRLELLLAASDMDPLSFVLTPNVQAKAQPRPVRRIRDGDAIEVLINGVTWADRLGESAAPEGQRYFIMDLTVSNTMPKDGVIAQPEQFVLSDGQAEFKASGATEKLVHPLLGEHVVPAGRRGRFEVAFEVPKDTRSLRLKYTGYTKTEEVPLP